jgi:succinyl-CoA synthetase beta subunit
VSRDIIHKSDVGGVALNLLNRSEVIDAYEAILQNCRSIQPDAKIEGVEISEMLQPGVELIIGARKDKIFGPVMAFGSGGKYVEVIKDVSFRALPVGKKEMMAMIEETRAYTLLLGVRGEEKKDLDKVLEVMQRLSELIIRCPEISDIEVNPLVVYEYGKGAKALDIRVLLTNPEGGVK